MGGPTTRWRSFQLPQFIEALDAKQAVLDRSLVIAAPAFWLTQGAQRAELFKVLLDHGADPAANLERATVMCRSPLARYNRGENTRMARSHGPSSF